MNYKEKLALSRGGRLLPGLTLLVMLTGCATSQSALEQIKPMAVKSERQFVKRQEIDTPSKPDARFRVTPDAPLADYTLKSQPDTDISFNVEPSSINVSNIPLPAFINEVFGSLLKLNFQIEKSLTDRKDLVSFRVTEKQPPKVIYDLAKQVLSDYGVATVYNSGLVSFFNSANPNQSEAPLLVSGRALPSVPESHRPVFQFVPLNAVKPGDIAITLSLLFQGRKLDVKEDIARNAFLLKGPQPLVREALEVIRFLDQPLMRGKNTVRIDPLFVDAKVLEINLINVLKSEGYQVGASPENKGIVIISLEGLNSLLAFAPEPQILSHIKSWAEELDQPRSDDKARVFFYQVENTTAAVLSDTVSELFSESRSRSRRRNTVSTETNTTSGETTAQEEELLLPQGLVVDEAKNMIIYRGKGTNWLQIRELLQQLDKAPKQVMLEVSIAEVTLKENEEFGIDWLASSDLGKYAVSWGTQDSLNLGSNGFNAVFSSMGAVKATLNAYALDSRVKILSSPKITVTSGEEASINVGNELPIITSINTSTAITDSGDRSVVETVQYRKTGVQLNAKPTVRSNNMIDLELQQSVSEVAPDLTTRDGSPAFFSRDVTTKVSLGDGQSLVVGGIISESQNKGSTGIPLLKDLPVLGAAFQSQKLEKSRTEMLIVISPYIIEDKTDIDSLAEQLKSKLSLLH